MMHNDVLMRQIQQMSQVLAQMLFNKRNEQYDEALNKLRQSTKQFLNIDLTKVEELDFETIWDALHMAGGIDPQHAGLVAELLRHQGDIHRIEDRPTYASRCYELSLHLYLMLHEHPGTSMDYRGRVNLLLDHVEGYDLPPETQDMLIRYLLEQGDFAQAENLLFVWAESSPDGRRERGEAFYDALQQKADDELENGGLPRDEVKAGRQDFIEQFG